MLAAQPDGLMFIANAVDVARLSQQAVKQAPTLPKSAAEWATSDALIELGGRPWRACDRAVVRPRRLVGALSRIPRQFPRTFGREPGYSAINSHDAATVVIEAVEAPPSARRGAQGCDPAHRGFDGCSSAWSSTVSATRAGPYFTEIRDGRFVLIR